MQYFALATEAHIKIVCDVIELRIKNNFSAVLFSQIIGRPYNYVTQMEAFQQPCYPLPELRKIAKVFGAKGSPFWEMPKPTDEKISICMKKTKGDGFSTYSCKAFKWKSRRTFLDLKEPGDIRKDIFSNDVSDLDLTIGLDMFDVLVHDKYFYKPRLPIDVYARMEAFLKLEVDPGYVLFLLETYTADFHPRKLKTLMIGGSVHYVQDKRL